MVLLLEASISFNIYGDIMGKNNRQGYWTLEPVSLVIS